jgi:hypothetical protein
VFPGRVLQVVSDTPRAADGGTTAAPDEAPEADDVPPLDPETGGPA